MKTPLGWMSFGPCSETTKYVGITNYLSSKDRREARSDKLYNVRFKIDPIHRAHTSKGRKALDAISKSIQVLNRHYQIALPWCH